MKRTVQFIANGERCKVTVETRPHQRTAPALTIDLKAIPDDAVELSITGELTGSCGQVTESLSEAGRGNADIQRLCEIWDRYHLNGMKAGTRAQHHYLDTLPRFTGADAYDKTKAALAEAGLQPDRNTMPGSQPYSYGSAWLYEPLPDDLLSELDGILTRLDGARIGEAPDLDEAPEVGGDVIDSRDVIKRLEIYRAAVEAMGVNPDDVVNGDWPECAEDDSDEAATVEEFVALHELEQQAKDCSDWDFGSTLVADSHFEDFARNEAEELGLIKEDAEWPYNHIDWDAAATSLKSDYTSVTFKGDTYLVRS